MEREMHFSRSLCSFWNDLASDRADKGSSEASGPGGPSPAPQDQPNNASWPEAARWRRSRSPPPPLLLGLRRESPRDHTPLNTRRTGFAPHRDREKEEENQMVRRGWRKRPEPRTTRPAFWGEVQAFG